MLPSLSVLNSNFNSYINVINKTSRWTAKVTRRFHTFDLVDRTSTAGTSSVVDYIASDNPCYLLLASCFCLCG
jgi:hypothetical protein